MQVVTVRLTALLLMWVSETSAEGKCQAIEMVSDHFPSGVIQHSLLQYFTLFLMPFIWNRNTFKWLTLHRLCKSKSYVAVMNLSLLLRSLWNSFTSAVCFTNIKEWKGQVKLNNFMQFGGKKQQPTNKLYKRHTLWMTLIKLDGLDILCQLMIAVLSWQLYKCISSFPRDSGCLYWTSAQGVNSEIRERQDWKQGKPSGSLVPSCQMKAQG